MKDNEIETQNLRFKCLELAMKYNDTRASTAKGHYMHPNEIGTLAEELYQFTIAECYCININNYYLGRPNNHNHDIHPNEE